MAERPAIEFEVRFILLDTGEVLIATRPNTPGAKWSVQGVEVEGK